MDKWNSVAKSVPSVSKRWSRTFFSSSQIKGFETLSVPFFRSIHLKRFKAESDIISFSKPLAQETSSQIRAQNIFQKLTSAKILFSKQEVPKKNFQSDDRQKGIFKAMTAKKTFSKKYQKIFKATSAKKIAQWVFIWSLHCSKKWNLECRLFKVGFQKSAFRSSGEHIFAKLWKRNASQQTNYRKCILQLTFSMQIRTKVRPAQLFCISLGNR